MCTALIAPGAMSPNSHVNTPAAIEQSGLSGISLQLNPASPGSVSVTVTSLAVPAPVLLTVIVNPMSHRR